MANYSLGHIYHGIKIISHIFFFCFLFSFYTRRFKPFRFLQICTICVDPRKTLCKYIRGFTKVNFLDIQFSISGVWIHQSNLEQMVCCLDLETAVRLLAQPIQCCKSVDPVLCSVHPSFELQIQSETYVYHFQ